MNYIYNKDYLKVIVICHGKSEKDICDVVKAELKLNMKIIFRSLFVSFLLCYACQNSTTEKNGLKTIYADITQ